jgi:hypothetical protein
MMAKAEERGIYGVSLTEPEKSPVKSFTRDSIRDGMLEEEATRKAERYVRSLRRYKDERLDF